MGKTMYFKQLQSDINNRVSKEWMELIVKPFSEQGVLEIQVDPESRYIKMGVIQPLLLEKAGMYKMLKQTGDSILESIHFSQKWRHTCCGDNRMFGDNSRN